MLVGGLVALLAVGPRPSTAQDAPPPSPPVTDPVPGGPSPTNPAGGGGVGTPPTPDEGNGAVPGEPPGEDAEVPPPPGPVPDPSPRVRALLATVALTDARAGLARAQGERAQVVAAIDEATVSLAAAEVARDGRRAEVDAARHQLQQLAVAAYMGAGGATSPATRDWGLYERRKGEQLTFSVVEHHIDTVDGARRRLAAAERDVADRQGALGPLHADLAARDDVVTQAGGLVAAAGAELGRAQAGDVGRLYDPDARYDWELAIRGDSVFSADELAAWAAERGGAARASVPAAELARLFIEEGQVEQIRGDVAFAQAVLETGWFTNDDTVRLNNYAGIGHCDTCASGFAFADARSGVRGQVQLLESYVEREPRHERPLVDPRLRGPAACCQTWNDLTGVWATTPIYAPLVLGVYLEMLEWLVPRRAAAPAIPAALAPLFAPAPPPAAPAVP